MAQLSDDPNPSSKRLTMAEKAQRKTRQAHKPESKTAQSQAQPPSLPEFLHHKTLPEAIEDAAFTSGGFAYDKRMSRKKYDKKLVKLQIELLKLQEWVKANGERIVVVFEGRDGAGKGGAIARIMQHLSPRNARVVALSKPTDTERGQWYFQRYAAHMPTKGEIVCFDRSWYNRAGVERVMGFATPEHVQRFMQDAPAFEQMLERDGIRIIKLFLTIGREMQMHRLHQRYHDPLKRWKLSPIDFAALDKWNDYSLAFEAMLKQTDTAFAPWNVVEANDKLRARLNIMRAILHHFPYPDRDEDAIGRIDESIILSAGTYLAKGGEPEV
jgi:polyphosphate kinase